MKQRTSRPGSPGLTLWAQGVRPILAGAVAAVGVIGVSVEYGVVGMLAVYLGLSLFSVSLVWSFIESLGMSRSRVVRDGFAAATILMVLVGMQHFPFGSGFLVALAVGLTSPPALGLLTSPRRRRASRRAPTSPRGALMDPTMVDRRFADIVSQLQDLDDLPDA
jgi:hypothetical protein